MNFNLKHTRRFTTWAIAGVASLITAVSALGQLSRTQSTAITIRDNNTASPYPSVINIPAADVAGTIGKATVRLNGVSHGYPDDIDILLLSPSGDTILLMSDAGDLFDITGVDLTFDQGASGTLPNQTQIVSGTYKPSNYETADDAFAGGPTAPYSLTLNDLKGDAANGDWKLYVVDDAIGDSGVISSWTLDLWLTPTATLATNRVVTTEDTPATLNLTVADTDTPVDSLTIQNIEVVSGTSVIEASRISASGSGANRSLTLNPKSNASGTATIRFKVSDGVGSTTKEFTFEVTPVNDAPTIALSTPTTATKAGLQTTNIDITIGDVDNDPSTLVLQASSANQNIVADSNVFFSGSGANRTVSIVPTGAVKEGSVDVTVRVIDGSVAAAPLTNSAVLNVTVQSVPQALFGNANRITVGDNALASSSVTVSNITGLIGKVVVALTDVEHTRPEDLGVLLVSPTGKKVVLMRAAGNANAISNGRLTFNQAASAAIPDQTAISTGSYQPADYGIGDFLTGAPAGPYATSLNAFNWTDANGTWTLYVQDTATGETGEITGGFLLTFYPAPVVGTIANKTTAEDTKLTVTFSVSDFDGSVTNLTASSADTSLVTVDQVSVSGTSGSLRLNPVLNRNGGPVTIEVVAQDNDSTDGDGGFKGTNSFTVTITSVNDNPTISDIAKQVTRAGAPVGPISFIVGEIAGDNETPVGDLIVRGVSDNSTVLPPSNIVFGGSGANRTITLYPSGTTASTRDINITVEVTDNAGGSATETFQLAVLEPSSPLFEDASPITINNAAAATPYPSVLTVANLVGRIADVSVTLHGLNHPAPEDLDIALVAPSGKRIILMSDAGGANEVVNANLVFSDGGGVLPDNTLIASGTYQAVNYDGGDSDNFGSSLPSGTVVTAFSGFDNEVANGQWKLFIIDDSAADRGGVLTGGWQLSIRTIPTLPDSVGDQVTQEDVARRVGISIGDSQLDLNVATTDAPFHTGTADVIDTIEKSISGTTLTLNIIPTANASGTNVVTVTVTDPVTLASDSVSFNFIVTAVNDAPTISNIPNQSTPAATPIGPINFTIGDVETPGSLNVTAASVDNTTLVPQSAITLSGTGLNRSISILPAGVETGQATIRVSVSDGTTSSSDDFVLTVTPNVSFANNTRITINDHSPANPYPSTINVSGVQGRVSAVSVILVGFSHPFPDDVDILLVSPDNSKKIMLMSDAGGGNPVPSSNPARLTFTATATQDIPDSGAITSGSFRPVDYTDTAEGSETLPSPAPARPYSIDLTSLAGVSPNGDWKLFVRDDTFPDSGMIEGGWILLLETGPTINDVADQTTSEDTQLVVPFTIADQDTVASNLVVTVSKNETLAPGLIASLTLPSNVNNNNTTRNLTILPSANRPVALGAKETNTVTLTVTDEKGNTANDSFNFIVVAVNDPPTLTTSTNRVVKKEDDQGNALPYTINFTIKDVDSTLGATNVTVTSTNPNLVPNSRITVTGPGVGGVPGNLTPGTEGTATLNIVPLTNTFGSTVLTVTLTDRNTPVSTDVTLEVEAVNDLPTITGDFADKTVQAGTSTTNITFTVGDVETPARNLTVTAKSRSENFVPNSNIVLGGSSENRTIQVTTIGTSPGTAVIEIVVADEANAKTTNTFNVVLTQAPESIFANTAAITIRDNNTAQPYPSTISVSGMRGPIHRVRVTVDGLAHTAPDDIDILLVGPTGKKIVLMSDAGGANAVSNVRLTFSDTGRIIGDETPLVSETYAPANYGGTDTFASPAPAGPYASTLAEFNGTDPNGTWSLYIVDDAAGNTGTIAFGWSLSIETRPTITLNPATLSNGTFEQWAEDSTGSIAFTIDDMVTPLANLELIPASDNPTLLPPANVTFDRSGGQTVVATLTSVANLSGTNNLTITVRRPSDGSSSQIVVPNNVTAVDDLPTLTRTIDRTTQEDTPITFEIQVQDIDTALSGLWLEALSSNDALISDTNVVFNSSTNLQKGLSSTLNTVTLRPNLDATSDVVGSSTITIILSTGGDHSKAVTNEFLFTVTPRNDPPTITDIPNKTFQAGITSTNIPFTVTDPEAQNVTITTSSSPSGIVTINVDVSAAAPPGARNLTVTTAPGIETETATVVTVRVTDAGGAFAEDQFTVTVLPTRDRIFTSTDGPITIRDNASAQPYPSVIPISGFAGNVNKIIVRLNDFTHPFPADADILLVSPAGQKVILMSDAGGGSAVTDRDITFDQAASSAIPEGSLASGTYQPANYGGSDTFASPAPSGPYTTSLNDFKGASPNGDWKLFVMDDTPPDAGRLASWTITLATEPVIVGLADLSTTEDVPARGTFTIAEESFASTEFTFTVTSTNTALVPSTSAAIAITGTGTNRTIVVTPTANASGETEITVSLSNPAGQTVSDKFKVVVTAVNDLPVITAVADQTITAGGASPVIPFDYSDVETEKKDLILTITSSEPSVIPTSNVLIVGNQLRIVSEGTQTGQSRITLTVTEPGTGGQSVSTSFLVTVVPALNPQFANTTGVTINDNSPGSPYPSTIEVSRVVGNIVSITVTLTELTHNFPDDVDILLVGPQGQKVVLMSDAGSGGPAAVLNNARITFDDAAAEAVPDNAPITAFASYRPANYEGTETFPTPAPVPPYSTSLGVFAGTDPNGTWSLYVLDDAAPDPGSLGGWLLNIVTTAPVIGQIADQTIAEDSSTSVSFQVSDGNTAAADLAVTASTDDTPVVNVTVTGTGNTRTLNITGLPNANGSDTITVSISDGTTTVTRGLTVTVTPVNDAPTISGLVNTNTPANVRLRTEFTVSDVETSATDLTVTAAITSGGGGTVSIDGSGATRTLVFNPTGEFPTNATVAVVVSDADLSTTNEVVISVIEPLEPRIADIADLTVQEDSTVEVPISVTTTVPESLVVTGSAVNADLVSSVTITGTGTSRTAVIRLVSNAHGSSAIVITATDSFGTAAETFTLTVQSVPDAPTLASIPDQSTNEDVPVTIPLTVTDVDTALTALTYEASISNPGLVSGVTFTPTESSVSATVNLVPNQHGFAAIIITVSDGTTSVSRPFALSVAAVDDPPVIGAIADITAKEDELTQVTVPVSVTDIDTDLSSLKLTATSSNPNLVSAATLTVSDSTVSLNLTIPANANGQAVITITAQDTGAPVSQSFNVNVESIPDRPTLGAIGLQTTPEDTPLQITLDVSDADTALSDLTFSGIVTDTSILQSVSFAISGNTVVATITPVAEASGTASVIVTVDDGSARVSRSFQVRVTPVDDQPVLGPIADQNTKEDQPVSIVLSVSDRDTALADITFTGTSSNSQLVSGVSFSRAGDVVTATVNLVSGASGTADVTISASDATSTVSQTFKLNVEAIKPPTLTFGRLGTKLKIILSGSIGAKYVLEGSTNLTTWTDITTLTIGSNGTAIIEVGTANPPARFFRARKE